MNSVLQLDESAHEHLLMHFTRNGAFGPGGKPVLVLERGEGPYVFDTEGNRYFDALSALFCSQIGYSYGEEMAAAAAEQLAKLAFSTDWGDGAPAARRARRARWPSSRRPALDRVFFTSGGSESVEAAWKIVRHYHLATSGEPQRTKAIAREIAYHGVTLGRAGAHRRDGLQGAVRRRRRSPRHVSRTTDSASADRASRPRRRRGVLHARCSTRSRRS